MTKKEVGAMLLFLNDIYPSFKFEQKSKERKKRIVKSWHLMLGGFDFKAVLPVVRKMCLRKKDFVPDAGQIARAVLEKDQMDGIEAWEFALDTAIHSSQCDNDKDILKDTPEKIKRTVKAIGGLDRIRVSKVDDPFFRKNFIETYKSISDRLELRPNKALEEKAKGKRIDDSIGSLFPDIGRDDK